VITYCFLESWMAGSESLYAFLPFALAGFATAIVFGFQLLGICPVVAKVPDNTNHSQKEQPNETNVPRSVA
jgi:hypothetical protein